MIHVVPRTAATEPRRAVIETFLPSMETSPSNCENNIAVDRDVHICYRFRNERLVYRLVNRLVLFRVGKGMPGVVLFIFTADQEVIVFFSFFYTQLAVS